MDLKMKNKILESATLLSSWCTDLDSNKKTTRQDTNRARDMEKKICGIEKLEKATNKEIRKKTGRKDIGETIIKFKWRYRGHIVRYEKNKWGTKILNQRSLRETTKRGRLATIWRETELKIKKLIKKC